MRLSVDDYRSWKYRRISLLGMSGVGKTVLTRKLPSDAWFHYSGDYRIGTAYLAEQINDSLKEEAMQVPALAGLLRDDAIDISCRISFDNLRAMSAWLGKIGDPEKGGLSLAEFVRRQQAHHEAEVRAMYDVPHFIDKAERIYGYPHFINDAGGSLCELQDPGVIPMLAEHTLLLYIRASESLEDELIERARRYPKPLYYPEELLTQALAEFRATNGLEYIAEINPDEFVRWVFPRLFRDRLPRYQRIADRYGYVIGSDEVRDLRDEQDFDALVEAAIGRHQD